MALRPDTMELDETPPLRRVPPPLSRLDEDAIMLGLRGGSVVDWTGLHFRTIDEVTAFLRLWHCDTSRDQWARERLRYLYNQAVNYLEEQIGLRFPAEVRRPSDVREAFLRASMRQRFSRSAIQYCAILKLVHVINHLEMQELRNQCAIREIDLIEAANEFVLLRARQLRAEGFPIRAFYGNRKTRPSIVTKLLAKRESTAATVFDKLRFRIVTETREDLVPAIAWLFRNLVPFPAVIPGESINTLLDDEEVLAQTREREGVADLLRGLRPADASRRNPDSGGVYRVINFCVGLPVRVYDLPGVPPPRKRALLGEAVPVLTEFQVVDAETDVANESGDNRHDLYKARQMERVYERLGRASRSRKEPGM